MMGQAMEQEHGTFAVTVGKLRLVHKCPVKEFLDATLKLRKIKGYFHRERKEFFRLVDIRTNFMLPSFRRAQRQAMELPEEVSKVNPSGMCMCGCGDPAPLASKTDNKLGVLKGQPRKYIQGHHKIKPGFLKGAYGMRT